MDTFDRIEVLLVENKISKRAMCIDLKMPYSTLSSMFQRRSKSLDIETLKKIAQYLSTTLEYLITGNEDYRFPSSSFPSNTISIVTEEEGTFTYNGFSDEEIKAVLTILDKMAKDKK